MTGFLSALVLLSSFALLILTLRTFYSPPSRLNLIAGRSAMAFFAVMAAYCFWLTTLGRAARKTEFYDLPAPAAGLQKVTLRKPGILQGYRARFVMKQDKAPAPAAVREKLQSCRWQVSGQELQVPGPASFGWDAVLFDHPFREGTLDLSYQVTEETKVVFSQVMLEVTGCSAALDAMVMGAGAARAFMVGYLCAMMFAAFGVATQRRRMRTQTAAGKTEPPTS